MQYNKVVYETNAKMRICPRHWMEKSVAYVFIYPEIPWVLKVFNESGRQRFQSFFENDGFELISIYELCVTQWDNYVLPSL